MKLIDSIKKEEGFSGSPYKDSLGFLTIGYGTKLPISEKEGELLLNNRLMLMVQELNLHKSETLNKMPVDKLDVIYNLMYQIGVPGLLKFKKMWAALEQENYSLAADEMLDSKWKRQTPARAKRLSERMRSISKSEQEKKISKIMRADENDGLY